MRYVSGGFHLTSSLACCLMTIIVMTALAHIDYPYFYTGLIFDIASFFLLLWKAPEGIENVSRIHPKYYPVLKVIALLSVSSNFFLHSSLLSSVFLTQSLTLLQVSYRIFDIIERRVAR
jgi:accessory gene regulator B